VTAVLLHDLGDPAAGAPWRAACPVGWLVPDLPGHGGTPAPRNGAYDPLGPATLARWALDGSGLLVGVRQNAHGALIVAAGGACGAVAVVDGLWGPWEEPAAAIAGVYAGLRATLDDDAAVARPPRAGLDPRARHGYGVSVSASFAQRFWGVVACPVLLVETPASPTPADERGERAGWFGGPTTLVEVAADDPAEVVAAIAGWWERLDL
jgi:hypothetical protein